MCPTGTLKGQPNLLLSKNGIVIGTNDSLLQPTKLVRNEKLSDAIVIVGKVILKIQSVYVI